jgi:hypothetical protein
MEDFVRNLVIVSIAAIALIGCTHDGGGSSTPAQLKPAQQTPIPILKNAPGTIADGIGSGYDYSASGQLRESKDRRYTDDGSLIISTFECRLVGNETAGAVLYLNVNNDSMILKQSSNELHLERETNDFSEDDKNDLFWKVAYFGKQSVLGQTVFTHAFVEPAVFTKSQDQIQKDGIALSLRRGDVNTRYSHDFDNYICR